MKLAIVFSTGREEPKLDWIVDGIEQQAHPGDDVTLIVIDAVAAWTKRDAKSIGFRETPLITRLVESAPKPNPWQGPHRQTSREWFAMSNARNTGICLVPDGVDYVAFLDDRAKLGPSWWESVRRGFHTRNAVLAGSYEKVESTSDGGTKTTRDHRLERHPKGQLNCGGGWLYGCSVALPLEWALGVNGFEEAMDGLTFEDVIFGFNLEHAGHRIDYVADMFVSQDRIGTNASTKGASYACRDKGVSPADKSHAALGRFGKRVRTELTPDLRELRAHVARGGAWPLPPPDARDWYDGELIRDMTS